MLSTPFGRRGVFYEEWTGGEGWKRYEVPATKCPRIFAAFLEEERRALGDWWYAQEYMCSFEDTPDQLFSHEIIEGMVTDEIEPLRLRR
jgi:hypothetical protein